MSIIDACRSNPKGAWVVRSGTVRVVFHDPIPADINAFAGDERAMRDGLTKQLFEAVASSLPDDQKPLNANENAC